MGKVATWVEFLRIVPFFGVAVLDETVWLSWFFVPPKWQPYVWGTEGSVWGLLPIRGVTAVPPFLYPLVARACN